MMRVLLFVCLVPTLAFAQAPALDSTYIPSNVHITSSAPQSATLEWNKVDGATAYRVWYGISSDNLDYAGDTPFPQFQKSHLMEGAKYFFAISTVIDTKESPRSAPLTCQLPSGTPAPWATATPSAPQSSSGSVTATTAIDSSKATTVTGIATPAPSASNNPADTVKPSVIGTTTFTAVTTPAPSTNAKSTDTVKTITTGTTTSIAPPPNQVTAVTVTTPTAPTASVPPTTQDTGHYVVGSTTPAVTEVKNIDITQTSHTGYPSDQSIPTATTATAPSPAPATPPAAAPVTPTQKHPAKTRVGNSFSTATITSQARDFYTVQIEASQNLSAVQGHLEILEARGVDHVRIEEFVNKGIKWYRLRAGQYSSPLEAKTSLASLKWTHKAFGCSGPLMFYNDRVVK